MIYRSNIQRGLGLGSALFLAALSHAQQYDTTLNFSVQTQQPIYDVMIYANGNGYQDHDFPHGPFGEGPNSLTGFSNDSPQLSELVVGLIDNLPGDGGTDQDPVSHVVLFMDTTAASDAENIAWGTLFRNTDENQLIAAIQASCTGGAPSNPVDDFANGDAQNGILNPDDTTQSAWFTVGSAFTIETWSGGQVIGSGTSQLQSVPEPAPMAALGLGALGLLIRRRRKA